MRWLFVAVVFAGCYAPSVPSGVSCSESGICPRGQSCVAGVCDGMAGPDRDGSTDTAMFDAAIDAPIDGNPITGWAVPTKVPQISSDGDDFGPSLFANGLRIYLASDRTVAENFKIWYATRSSTAQPFSSPSPTGELDLTGDEYDPEVSGAGLELHYASDDAPAGVRRSTRANISVSYTAPPEIVSIGANREGPSLALGDLLMVVSIKGTGGIEEWTRPDTATPWALVRSHPSLVKLSYPGISSDGLELYATDIDANTLFRATRATLNDAFGMPQRQLFNSQLDTRPIYDAELTPDGKTMYLSINPGSSFDIYVTTRP